MELVRIICYSAVKYKFYFRVDHIKGVENKIADGLSRKENINCEDKKFIIGNGWDCGKLIDKLLQCWYKNMPSKEDITRSENNINYFMEGWDKYKKERRRNKDTNWSW